MCLIIDLKEKERFLRKHKGKERIVVWKRATKLSKCKVGNKWIDEHAYYTPAMLKELKTGWFKAKGRLVINKFNVYGYDGEEIKGGAIHVYVTRQEARDHNVKGKILRCEALLKDLIAVGQDGDACFSKIWVPKKELK